MKTYCRDWSVGKFILEQLVLVLDELQALGVSATEGRRQRCTYALSLHKSLRLGFQLFFEMNIVFVKAKQPSLDVFWQIFPRNRRT